MTRTVVSQRISLEVDDEGTWHRLILAGQEISFPGLKPQFWLDGKPAFVRSVSESEEGLVFALAGEDCTGKLRLLSRQDAIRGVLEIDNDHPYTLVRFEIALPPPPASALHLPAGYTYGHVVDAASPLGQASGVALRGRRWQFGAIELAGRVLALLGHSPLERLPIRSAGISWKTGGFRTEDALWLQVECYTGAPWELSLEDSLPAAIARYHRHVERDYGAVPWRKDPTVPEWFADIKMVVTLDMIRSQGEVTHSYAHLRNLVQEMKQAGMGGGVLFYLTGHHDLYDRRFPFFGPSDLIGGAQGFKEMVGAVHDAGHWVMPHCAIWSVDPYQPYFEEFEDIALIFSETEGYSGRRVGAYDASPGMHPVTPLDYDSGYVPLKAEKGNGFVTFLTPELPQPMEAHLTVSGVKNFASGQLRASLHYRELVSPLGKFAISDSHRFRFRFRFEAGVNRVRLDFLGGTPDLSSASFRINEAVYPGQKGSSNRLGPVWTHPHVRVEMSDPRWIKTIRNDLTSLVNNFGVDAIHMDAASVLTRSDLPIYQDLRQALPRTVFGCEFFTELALFFFHITQNADIPPESPHRTTDLAYRLGEPYLKFYLHLCQSLGFVPVGTACNHLPIPDKLTPELREKAERHWREGPKWHILPNIRLNYRDYSLDPRTREAFHEVLGGRVK
ncbi:MAG: hypothetical protein IT330_19295 [Anaerolineae bacterium]|nr:hypothetical protein [Anaerolineae bacterium]